MKGKHKHTPQRTCIICRRTLAKRELTRIVRTGDGVCIDPTGKMAGRGAYVCDDEACWRQLEASNALARALKTSLSPDDRARLNAAAAKHTHVPPGSPA
ncbi:MAG: YlxR family protein [Chloroflexi bacterium]|nr:YlxR family protein [Chloroflexota bacterium]